MKILGTAPFSFELNLNSFEVVGEGVGDFDANEVYLGEHSAYFILELLGKA